MTSYLSPTVLALLLPATLIAYQVAPRRARWAVLLLASYAFFWYISRQLIFFVLVSTLSIWTCGLALDRLIVQRAQALRAPGADRRAVKRRYQHRMRLVLAAGIVFNAGVLFVFKYLGFADRLIEPLAGMLGYHGHVVPSSLIDLAAPIGISFYTLQAISYLVDVYRQSISADYNLARVALFLSFFPQIMEGPICRYGQTAQALWAGHPVTSANVIAGSERIAWGLAKKLIVADRVNSLVKTVFSNYEAYDGGIIALAAVLYVIQLYCDFSGTMDFVVGAGRMFGVRMPENFQQPFFSRTGSEFWQRWHITLGTWFRDYVFYPLSLSGPIKHLTSAMRHRLGNRMGPLVASGVALAAVWLGNGLWHGAGGQYVLFGLFWFVVIWTGGLIEPFAQQAGERFSINRESRAYHAFQHARTLLIACCGELIFRAEGGRAALGMLGRLATTFSPVSLVDGSALTLGMDAADFACVAIAVVALFAVDLMRETGGGIAGGAVAHIVSWTRRPAVRWSLTCALVLIVIVFGAYGVGYTPVDPMYASF